MNVIIKKGGLTKEHYLSLIGLLIDETEKSSTVEYSNGNHSIKIPSINFNTEYCFRLIVTKYNNGDVTFGLNFEPEFVWVMAWASGRRISLEDFLNVCPEPYKDIFLFNLDLIT